MKRYLVAAICGIVCGASRAAPEEIQVYMDEMNVPGKFGLDVHNNYVLSGSGIADYPGALAPRHVFRLTPEFSYGLSTNWELGAYVLSSVAAGGGGTVDGQKLRLKFIASRDSEQAYFWGGNLEVGRVAHRFDENPWNAELKGIFGYRSRYWTLAINTNLDWKVSGPVTAPTTLDIDTKLAYKTEHGYELGLESYSELGSVHHLGHLNQHSQTMFAVIDTSAHGWDLNLGVGHGLTGASDRWLLKAIVSVPIQN